MLLSHVKIDRPCKTVFKMTKVKKWFFEIKDLRVWQSTSYATCLNTKTSFKACKKMVAQHCRLRTEHWPARFFYSGKEYVPSSRVLEF